MALDGSLLSSELESAYSSIGWNGSELTTFSNALGNGIIQAISGALQFTTQDTGQTPGNGVGVGTGVTGMDDTNMSGIIFNTGQNFWSSEQNNGPGTDWQVFCDQTAQIVVNHFSTNAQLDSTHNPVFDGTGTVDSYSGIDITTVKNSITSQVPSSWNSARFPELAEAVATGVVNEILGHSPVDTVTITGTASSTPTSPGTGTGSGVVT